MNNLMDILIAGETENRKKGKRGTVKKNKNISRSCQQPHEVPPSFELVHDEEMFVLQIIFVFDGLMSELLGFWQFSCDST